MDMLFKNHSVNELTSVLEFGWESMGSSALDQICWFLLKENYVLKITHGTLKYEEKWQLLEVILNDFLPIKGCRVI